jgi:3-oxoacyl-[acyl-carrier-protein] synthase III
MALFNINNTRISGISACLPKNEYNNRDYDWITPEERELLIKTTGIEKRRVAGKGITTADLCFISTEALLKDLGWEKNDVDILMFVSQSRDYPIPCTAVILQDRLGFSKKTIAFDVPLGCSGYIYGMAIMGSMISGGILRRGIILTGDISTINCAYEDKSTYPLFGDAGTATAMEYSESGSVQYYNLCSDGSGWEAISVLDGGIRNYVTKNSFDIKEIAPGIKRNSIQLRLNGIDVFNFSLKEVPQNIAELLTCISKTTEDIDYCVLHQANMLINESIRKKLRLAKEKVPYSINKYGNTSSASIPLTIVSEIRNQLMGQDLNLLLCGFGVGLSWGSVYFKTDKICCPDVIEI